MGQIGSPLTHTKFILKENIKMEKIEKLEKTSEEEPQRFKIVRDVEATQAEETTTIEQEEAIVANLKKKLAMHEKRLEEMKKL